MLSLLWKAEKPPTDSGLDIKKVQFLLIQSFNVSEVFFRGGTDDVSIIQHHLSTF